LCILIRLPTSFLLLLLLLPSLYLNVSCHNQ
jgi:hypothetical protein